jgi:putative hydrolase of the HAD superfamily
MALTGRLRGEYLLLPAAPTTGESSVINDIRAIVFDLDGTLYVNDELGRAINQAGIRFIAQLKGVDEKVAEELLREARQRLSAASGYDTPLSRACMELGADLRQLHAYFTAEINPRPYLKRDERVVDLLKILSTRFELYLYTNNNRALTEQIVDILGLGRFFKKVVTIDNGWRPKPDQEALMAVYRDINHAPDECIFVGDRYDVDLRLPASVGSTVYRTKSVDELVNLLNIMNEEKL